MRLALSELWNIDPLAIPLNALPGKVPLLAKGWGFISISHCSDALLIGWSNKQLGVDIERSDRHFSAEKLVNRYYSKEEQAALTNFRGKSFKAHILNQWIAKEAAIKWQRGSITSDFSKWMYLAKSKSAFHKSFGYKVEIDHIEYGKWIIAIAYEKEEKDISPIICAE